ncbi:MAG: chloride channel protein [Lachnospiraceae bacterium]|nr:chloride channel protein [Lachnospiraceae bacterium]
MTHEQFTKKFHQNTERAWTVIKWIIYSCMLGCVLGLVGALFSFAISDVTTARTTQPYFLLLLPVGAVVIRLFYHVFHSDDDRGTNIVLSAIHSNDEVPLRMSVLIFFSTILSHLAGASVGREGAALQLGGSLGAWFGRVFNFNAQDKKTMIMCGMSGVFAALFGTPMAAAVFAMEVVSVGIMHYAALLPCVITAYMAHGLASLLTVPTPHYEIIDLPEFSISIGIAILFFGAACGILSMLFCISLRQVEKFAHNAFYNRYLRAFVCGTLLLAATLVCQTQEFNGAGGDVIAQCMLGAHYKYAFLLKIIFTAVSIAAGYKGGEIVPSFFIGATFGSLIAQMTGANPSLLAAVGIGSVFCGVTNCPLSSLLICFELFGLDAAPYFIISIAISYTVSGYYGLYSGQKIVYSKYKSIFIDTKAR